MASAGGVLDPKQRAVLLGQATALLNHRRSGTVAALLLLSGGCYTYYLHQLSARQRNRLKK